MTASPLDLPQVTLCAVDTRSPVLALAALGRCLQQARFARALLLTDAAGLEADWPQALAGPEAAQPVQRVDIGPIRSSAEYSAFVLQRLPEQVHTAHVLIVQWDGFILQPAAFQPAFLGVDYIGAPWAKGAPGTRVGNGGFSLRSQRLLQALRQPSLAARAHHPEDICIGQTLRPELEQRHGIVFADVALAARFACEHTRPVQPSFGFHGLPNWAWALSSEELARWLPALPTGVAASREGFKLARALLRAGQPGWARWLVRRAAAEGASGWRWRWLGALSAARARRSR